MSEPDVAIRTRALTKRYGALEAVRSIDLDVRAGEIFGLIGPDGAGKTSTFQILGGVMEATSGAAELLGQPARRARAYVGYLTQVFSLYPDLSVAENLRYVGELRRVPVPEIERRGNRYLTMFGMERFIGRLAGRLSGGMKQKLALACALVTEPRILLLDEPTTGVDPVSRREFWDALAQLSSQGMTILLATPYLDEAERCHRVALMHDGRLHRTGTPAELRQSLGLQRLEVRARDLRRAETALAHRDGIVDVQRFGDRLDVLVREVQSGERAVRDALGDAVESVRAASPTLENTFVAILRGLEGETRVPPFPDRREHEPAGDPVAIGARGLRKTFGNFVAVKGIDLEVRYGEVYGLLGAAIMHEPRVLFLDEPTSGVDPIARRAFWAMINQLADQGTAILVTTHYLEEAEQCNRLGFMVAGELVAEGTPSGVKAAQGGRVLEILADEPLRAVAPLKTAMEPWRVSLFGDRLHVIVAGDAPAAARELTARLARDGIRVLDAREEDYSLEDVFLVIAEKGAVAA